MSVSQVSVSLSALEAGVLALLLPYLAVTAVDRAVISGDLVSIWVRAAADGAAGPGARRCAAGTRGGCVIPRRAAAVVTAASTVGVG
jgi:hypothetical protein